MFATFPDGTTSDQSRWEDFGGGVGSDIGWQYAALNIGSLATMADAFARTGDYELVNYSTSAGADGTSGGPKSLSQMVNLFMGYVNHTVNRFTPGHAGNNNYRIDTVDLAAGGSGDTADDHSFSQINLYYKNTTNKSLYMRTASGTPPYPTTYSTGGWEAWNGEWGIYPAPLFMFGQMEGQVLPYPTASSQLPAINFSAVPDIITSGQSSVLTWSTTNATSCAGSGGWTGTIPTSGTQTVTPAQTTTFTLSCTGSAGTATQSTTITVSAPPSAPTNFTVSVAP
jgi:hypothetical protein